MPIYQVDFFTQPHFNNRTFNTSDGYKKLKASSQSKVSICTFTYFMYDTLIVLAHEKYLI